MAFSSMEGRTTGRVSWSFRKAGPSCRSLRTIRWRAGREASPPSRASFRKSATVSSVLRVSPSIWAGEMGGGRGGIRGSAKSLSHSPR